MAAACAPFTKRSLAIRVRSVYFVVIGTGTKGKKITQRLNGDENLYIIFIVTKKSSFFKLLEFFFYRKIKMKQNLHVFDSGERIREYYAI